MAAPKRIRNRNRKAVHDVEVRRVAVQMAMQAPDRENEILEEAERRIAQGPDFTRYHRNSRFQDPPNGKMDRNEAARIMQAARTVESKSWRNRKKGKHGGLLGRAAMRLLEVLLYVVKKDKGCFPSYSRLATLCRMSRRTVVSAMATLEFFGFVTVHRRIKRMRTQFGFRVVQDSNAYEIQMPAKGVGAMMCSVFGISFSECKKCEANKITNNNIGKSMPQPPRGLLRGSKAQPPENQSTGWSGVGDLAAQLMKPSGA